MIRKLHPTSIITYFIHVPWPDARCWQLLPSDIAYDIFSSLVSGNDIIGFQTTLDANNFLESAHLLLKDSVVDFENGVVSWRNHAAYIRIYPISISIVEERRLIQSTMGKQAATEITPFTNKKIIMRVDRVDPIKNIVNGLHAFSEMLSKHVELCDRVVFLVFLLSSRQTLSSYRHYRAQIVMTVEKINKKYGSSKWTPIHLFFDKDRTFVLSAMRFYDVLFVNPILDGMNLVAKEGSIVNQNNGVLILSRTAGAYQQLREAVIPISPIDIPDMAEAVYKALTISQDERNKKWKLARRLIKNYDLNAWFNNQIQDINKFLNVKTIK